MNTKTEKYNIFQTLQVGFSEMRNKKINKIIKNRSKICKMCGFSGIGSLYFFIFYFYIVYI